MDKIVVNNVSKAYKMYNSPVDKLKEAFSFGKQCRHTDFWALSNVDFSVKDSEILGIMGRNGAGKSTLLKIITGVLEPTYGNVKINGRISSLLELGAGFNPEYSGIDNVYFYGTLMKLSKEQMDERLDDILAFAEIGDYVYQPVKTYSSGMFARLAFACAINVNPDVLIVDEILSVGDMRFQAKCFNKFKDFKNKGVTILYVGHDVGLMKSFCDRAIWMNEGKIVMDGEPVYVASQYTEFMYLDECTEITEYKKMEEGPIVEIIEEPETEEPETEEPETEEPETEESISNKNETKEKSGKQVLNHWGTRVGMVEKVMLTDEDGQEQTVFGPNEILRVYIKIKTMPEIDYEKFSLSFSIKNIEGTDLIVKSTYDEKYPIAGDEKYYDITFSFKCRLASGEYYLVIALEDRTQNMIMYYEYIEGVKYFKVYSEKPIYGIVDLDTDISIKRGYDSGEN